MFFASEGQVVKSLVITEKASQAQHVGEAVGTRFGRVLPARGHLLDLVEPDQVKAEWKAWSTELLHPGHLYPKAVSKERGARQLYDAIATAARDADRIIIATDCDREGQLIGQEIVEAIRFRGEVLRVMFNAEDPKSLQQAFAKLAPNSDFTGLYNSAVARQQADQICNLSMTRAATVVLKKPGAKGALGVGRVKTPTLAIVARRELEILGFKPRPYFEVVATAGAASGTLTLRCSNMPGSAPPTRSEAAEQQDPDAGADEAASLTDAGGDDPMRARIVDRALADGVAQAARGYAGPLAVSVKNGSLAPPKLHDLTSLQTACSAKFGWSGDRTLQLAQALYSEHKILTYPRAEARYLAENQISEAPELAAALAKLPGFAVAAAAVRTPTVRKGKDGHFSDKQLAGLSHHAIVPNFNMRADFARILPALSQDEARLFDLVARTYLAALMPDFTFRQTDVSLAVPYRGAPWIFRTSGRQPLSLGWRALYPGGAGPDDAPDLPPLKDGERATVTAAAVEAKETKPPGRYTEGTLLKAMQEAWRFVADPELKKRLKDAKGIGTPATRASVIKGLFDQAQLERKGKQVRPTAGGLELYKLLEAVAPELNDPARTAIWELTFDMVERGALSVEGAVDRISRHAKTSIEKIVASGSKIAIGRQQAPTPKMLQYAKRLAQTKGLNLSRETLKDADAVRRFLDEHAPRKEGEGGQRHPSETQLRFAQSIAAQVGASIPADALHDAQALSRFIDDHKVAAPPSEKQLQFARRLADERSLELPPDVVTSSTACSAFIEEHAGKRTSPRRGGKSKGLKPDGP